MYSQDVLVNKISYPEYKARVDIGDITPSMISEQVFIDYNFTMEVEQNCINLKPVAMSGSYNDLTDKPEIPTPVTVINTLDSTSETDALSAYQGNMLNQDLTSLSNEFTNLNDNVGKLSSDLTTLTTQVNEIPVIDVINDLTSSSTTAALSAAQGQVLNNAIKTNAENITTNATNISKNSDAITLQADLEALQGQVPTGTKMYLHQITISVINANRNKTAYLFIDYYSTQDTPYTSVGFVEIPYRNPYRCGGYYLDLSSSTDSKAAWQVSIVPFNGTFAFIVNGSNGVEVDADLQASTITDNVIGYLYK